MDSIENGNHDIFHWTEATYQSFAILISAEFLSTSIMDPRLSLDDRRSNFLLVGSFQQHHGVSSSMRLRVESLFTRNPISTNTVEYRHSYRLAVETSCYQRNIGKIRATKL
jgi:hypothetical protein